MKKTFIPWPKANKSHEKRVIRARRLITGIHWVEANERDAPGVDREVQDSSSTIYQLQGDGGAVGSSVNHEPGAAQQDVSSANKSRRCGQSLPQRYRFKHGQHQHCYFTMIEKSELAQCQRAHGPFDQWSLWELVQRAWSWRRSEEFKQTAARLRTQRGHCNAHKTKPDRVIPMNSRQYEQASGSKIASARRRLLRASIKSKLPETELLKFKRSFRRRLRLSGIQGATFHTTRHHRDQAR